jgi:hypothetical protein
MPWTSASRRSGTSHTSAKRLLAKVRALSISCRHVEPPTRFITVDTTRPVTRMDSPNQTKIRRCRRARM